MCDLALVHNSLGMQAWDFEYQNGYTTGFWAKGIHTNGWYPCDNIIPPLDQLLNGHLTT